MHVLSQAFPDEGVVGAAAWTHQPTVASPRHAQPDVFVYVVVMTFVVGRDPCISVPTADRGWMVECCYHRKILVAVIYCGDDAYLEFACTCA